MKRMKEGMKTMYYGCVICVYTVLLHLCFMCMCVVCAGKWLCQSELTVNRSGSRESNNRFNWLFLG